MANFQFTADLIADVLFRAGEPTDGTSDFNTQALQYLNRAYRSICSGGSEIDPSVREDWWWLRKNPPGVLILNPRITTGTVSATNNSATITFSSAPASSVAGYFFRVSGDSDMFRVSTHTGGQTGATLDSVYTGITGSGLTYVLMQLEYNLAADVIRVIAPMRIQRTTAGSLSSYKVHGIDLNQLEERYPLAIVEPGVPDLFAHVGETKVRFNRSGGLSSTELIRVEYDYLYRPAVLTSPGTAEEPVLPWDRRHILADVAVAYLLTDKNDNRASDALELARRGLVAMARDNQHRVADQSDHTAKIHPRCPGNVRRGPLRTSSGLIVG